MLKFHDDPTVNESEIVILQTSLSVCGKNVKEFAVTSRKRCKLENENRYVEMQLHLHELLECATMQLILV